jgi:hypothetical protein
MNREELENKVLVEDEVHPIVYLVMLGLVMGFGLAIFGIVASGLAGLALALAGLMLSLATLLLPAAMRARGRCGGDAGAAGEPSFAEWLAGDFVTWQARLKAGEALVQMLLPIAAVSFGMLAFALVLHFDVGA